MRILKAIAFMLSYSFLFLSYNNYLYAADRIFHEDCEDTTFSEYFLERHYGTNYLSYWQELTTELTRSDVAPHRGQYSMTYDPFATDNPHAVVGAGSVPYGNTSNFNLRNYAGRYWYFRWYQRWETGIDWGDYHVKMLYINYQSTPDFTFFIVKRAGYKYLTTLKDYNTYSLLVNNYFHSPGDSSSDDMEWHKLEIFIDVGQTGQANGSYWFKMDGEIYDSATNVAFNDTISNNPIGYITGWPSNLSGSGGSGTARTWLDDLEIYTLDDANDIPPELDGPPVDNSPTITIAPPISPTSSSTLDLSGTSSDDNGVTSINWSNSRGGTGPVSGDLSSWSVSGITLSEGENVISVTATDGVNAPVTTSVTVTYTPPVNSLSPPVSLLSFIPGLNQISLSWGSFGGSSVASYRILRNGSELLTTDKREYVDTGLASATSYTYTIIALDSNNNNLAEIVQSTATR